MNRNSLKTNPLFSSRKNNIGSTKLNYIIDKVTTSKTEIILALDVKDRNQADVILEELEGQLKWVKIGLQSFLRDGPELLTNCYERGLKIFLDLKLHDIPNTMSNAIESLASLPIDLLTIHCSAGPEALARCAETAKEKMPNAFLAGVTVLTSMNLNNLQTIGIQDSIENQVTRLAKLAVNSGIEGIVCSPIELSFLRTALPSKTKIITPGIRPTGSQTGDQKRIMTPRQAQQLGADFLVIGRPILSANKPAEALMAIRAELT